MLSESAGGGAGSGAAIGVHFVDDVTGKAMPVDGSGDFGGGGGDQGAPGARTGSPSATLSRLVGPMQAYYSTIVTVKNEQFRYLRPWTEFFDHKQFSMPSKLEVVPRMSRNIGYFYVNYIALASLCSLSILLSNPFFLLSALITIMFYFYIRMRSNANEELTIAGKPLSYTQGYVVLVVFGMISFFLTNGSSTVFWLILTSVAVVLAHAATREVVAVEEAPQFNFV